ncbi:hypothetical protein MTR_3g115280 [Medicago truncatula]|uniref:Uncharacterized protein n=1 Tax=Medicago truncatula TaxID=3880 RepID=A0A072V3S9_MEDTR|nr:hypothetical protein MTR_3g115280 [Medicago truncatula]
MDVWFTVIRTDGYELIDFVKLILAIRELNKKSWSIHFQDDKPHKYIVHRLY